MLCTCGVTVISTGIADTDRARLLCFPATHERIRTHIVDDSYYECPPLHQRQLLFIASVAVQQQQCYIITLTKASGGIQQCYLFASINTAKIYPHHLRAAQGVVRSAVICQSTSKRCTGTRYHVVVNDRYRTELHYRYSLAYSIPLYLVYHYVKLGFFAQLYILLSLLLRGAIVNRTYGIHKNLYI